MKTAMFRCIVCIFIYFCSGFIVDGQTVCSAQSEDAIRIMSYNIRNARGLDEKTDYQRIADVITGVFPDVVALQELDSVTERGNRTDVLAQIAGLTKMYSVYGASIEFQGGKYGIGILSKQKPISWKRIPLPGREEARSLLIVELPEYLFCCTHFSLTKEDRLASAEIINKAAAAFNKPAFLAGDINGEPNSPEVIKLKESWQVLSDPEHFTIPAHKPDRTIDFIFGYKGKGQSFKVLRTKVLNEPVASDHLPLYADVLMNENQSILRTNPYLQHPTTDGITVMWHTNVPCYSWVEYGTDTLQMTRARTYVEGEAMANNKLNRIRIEGLKPGTKYYYRIYSKEILLYEPYKKEFGETAVSPIASFTTLNNKKTDFTAVIFNDIHDRYELFDKLYAQVKDVPYDIVFFNGDCIADVQSEKNALRTIAYYSDKIGGNKVPSIYLRGNHETRGAYSMFLWDLLEKVGNRSYGAFNIGDTRFVLLDCGEDKPDDHPVYYDLNDFTQHRKDQAEFLRKEIASKEFQLASKRVLIHHIPVYGMSKDSFVPCRDYWGSILAKANFNVCLNGHTHQFTYIAKGKEGNIFPVIIGGGNNEKSATVMVLNKKGNTLNLKVLDTEGKSLLDLNL